MAVFLEHTFIVLSNSFATYESLLRSASIISTLQHSVDSPSRGEPLPLSLVEWKTHLDENSSSEVPFTAVANNMITPNTLMSISRQLE